MDGMDDDTQSSAAANERLLGRSDSGQGMPPTPDKHNTQWRDLMYFSAFVLAILLAVAAIVVRDTAVATLPTGVLPLRPTYCVSWQPNNQPYYVPLRVDGKLYAVLPDTGSSNLAIASESCASCDVHPPVPKTSLPKSVQDSEDPTSSKLAFETAYGTGATIAVASNVEITIDEGGMTLKNDQGKKDNQYQPRGKAVKDAHIGSGRAGLIVGQNTSFGFSLFPAKPAGGAKAMPAVATPSKDTCYNSYAGILGLAYQGQGSRAVPGYQGVGPAPTTNGTSTQLIDQLVSQLGMPNSFALEFCPYYPWSCTPQRRPASSWLPNTSTSTWKPETSCAEERVGHLLLGGYASGRLEESLDVGADAPKVVWAALTDEIHFDVQLQGMSICGHKGCVDYVEFPDKFDGVDESDCMCNNATSRCDEKSIADPSKFDYCYFSVVESGAGRIYMNTPGNAKALLNTMQNLDVVNFPAHIKENASLVHDFYFNKVPVEGAHVWSNSSFHVILKAAPNQLRGKQNAKKPNENEMSIRVPVELDGSIFRLANFSANQQGEPGGLVQWGIQGDMDVLKSFSENKFPTLLGDPFLVGKTTIFDRSRKRVGFGRTRRDLCTAGTSGVSAVAAKAREIDMLGANAKPTPGYGCRIGTGSGGGCPQARPPSR